MHGLIEASGISGTFLASIAGILMAAALMVHTGATVIDSLPQGNYFHVSADSMKMTIRQWMGVIPYEAIVGGTMAIVATILYGFIL
ncbi:H+/gluconate symporter-like permease [Paenibacillus sp. 2003]|nr:H+/gluconate symporter-like permease [Paenibacillus sp. 2003]